jgi:Protein of unknown function (DUF2971)
VVNFESPIRRTGALMMRPSVLYRYRSITSERFERELEAITGPYVWCASYRTMNDPMEGYYRAVFESSNFSTQTIEQVYQSKIDLGLTSFSETHDNELMWVHYAGNYTGICVEYQYDLLSELAYVEDDDLELKPIDYSEKPLELDVSVLRDGMAAARRILMQKKKSWSYEREWRLMGKLGIQKILPGTISKIYLGQRISFDLRNRLISQVQGKEPDIAFLQMEVAGYGHTWNEIS